MAGEGPGQANKSERGEDCCLGFALLYCKLLRLQLPPHYNGWDECELSCVHAGSITL